MTFSLYIVQHGRHRRVSRLALAIAMAFHGQAWALPQNGQIVSGQGAVVSDGASMTVRQDTPKMTLNWQSFSLGAGESLQFRQPLHSSIVLNRVLGQNPSQIMGALSANGQVFITNPNGILFGPNAQVDVAGLLASTGQLSDADFAAGLYRFSATGLTAVVNQGRLSARDQGYVALLAPQVINQGIISARLGSALLGAAEQVVLTLDDGSLLGYRVERGAIAALADNRGLVQADGGRIFMGALAADRITSAVVNNDGVLEAHTVGGKPGEIRLTGDMNNGVITGAGRFDVSVPDGGNGGLIETSAAHVRLGDSAVVTATAPGANSGRWLITAADYLLTPGGSNDSNKAVVQALRRNDVTITSTRAGNAADNGTGNGAGSEAGNITVDGTFSWLPDGGATTLTLVADNNIRFTSTGQILANDAGRPGNVVLKAGMDGSSAVGAGKLLLRPLAQGRSIDAGRGNVTLYSTPDLNPNAAGPENFSDGRVGGILNSWNWIHSVDALEFINTSPAFLAGNYALPRDLDASSTRTRNGGLGLLPIGTSVQPFTGRFDGMGHAISGVYILRSLSADNVGLFGTATTGSEIRNLGLADASIEGGSGYTGGIVGGSFGSVLSRLSITGNSSVIGHGSATGGLVGSLDGVTDSTNIPAGRLGDSWSEAAVTGGNNVGGVAGTAIKGIERVYSTGAVNGATNVGGVVGQYRRGGAGDFLRNVYSTSEVTGRDNVGGVAGFNSGVVESAYSQSNHIALIPLAGGADRIGAVVGYNTGPGASLNNIYWDRQSSGLQQAYSADSDHTGPGVPEGLSTAGMLAGVFPGFNPGIWFSYAGHTAPLLSTFMPLVTVTPASLEKTYDGQAAAALTRLDFSSNGVPATAAETAYAQGRIQADFGPASMARNAGVEQRTVNCWTGQQGFRLVDALGNAGTAAYTSTIDARDIELVPQALGKDYDGSRSSAGSVAASNLAPGDTLRASQSFDSAAANSLDAAVRTLSVDANAAILRGDKNVSSNYRIGLGTVTTAQDSQVTIRALPLTIRALADTRDFSGVPYSGGNGVAQDGLLASESLASLGGTLSYGGSAQGAIGPGTFEITPQGLTSTNYAITTRSGPLVINAVPEPPAPVVPVVPLIPLVPATALPGGQETYIDALVTADGVDLDSITPGEIGGSIIGLVQGTLEDNFGLAAGQSGSRNESGAEYQDENRNRLRHGRKSGKTSLQVIDGGIRMPR